MPGKHLRGQSTHFRVLLATLTAVSLAALGVAVAGNPASARGPGKGSSTVTAVPLNSPDGLAHYDGQVTFKVSTTVTTKPFVKLDCYQDGAYVYWSSAGFFPDYPDSDDYAYNLWGSQSFTNSNYSNPKVDKLLAKERATTDTTTREKAFTELQDLAAADAPTIPVWQGGQVAAVRDNIHGVEQTFDPAFLFRFWTITKD